MELTRIQDGSIVANGIRYNEYPPPQLLVKAMERRWAEELVRAGLMRLRKLEYYRSWENGLLGDPNDGEGLYHVHGYPMQTGSSNDVYAWCLSLPTIEPSRRLLLAQHGGYDCLLVIPAPERFFKKVAGFLSQNRKGFGLHCGLANYNRGEEIAKRTLNSQKFHHNVFQKSPRFEDDKEYRMAITNSTFNRLHDDHLDLLLGDCRDIMSIDGLPNKSLDRTS